MLEGSEVIVAGSGTNFTVNGECVVCGNVQTSNVTVYIVDTVAPALGTGTRTVSEEKPCVLPRVPASPGRSPAPPPSQWPPPGGSRCDVAHCGPWHATRPRPPSRLNQS
jgi:hypothetical protein